MDKIDLQRRTKEFALRILKLIDALPGTVAGRAIGANYRAACRARSRVEFAAKLGTVLEEADESLYWLEIIRDAKLLPENRISLLLKEADELTAIVAAGRKSVTRKTSNISNHTS